MKIIYNKKEKNLSMTADNDAEQHFLEVFFAHWNKDTGTKRYIAG